MIVVGDVKHDVVIGELTDLFGEWEPGDVSETVFGSPPERHGRTTTVVDRPGSAQSNIVLGNIGIKRTDPDYFPVLVMNQVLGAGASSRVFMNLREEKGYTYGAYTRLDTKRLSGTIEATAEVRTPVTGDSLREFFYELDRIRSERVGDEELKDAKNFLTGVFPLRAETQEGLTNLIVNQFLFGLPDDYLQTYRDNVASITADDVQLAAQRHVQPDEMAIVIVGDADEVIPQVREFSDKVEVFDTEGAAQDVSKYSRSDMNDTVDAAGKWDLKIDFQGQSLPVSLTLQQQDSSLTGSLDTMLGNGIISDGTISGNKVLATAKAEVQGRDLEFSIAGKIDGDAMSGTITTTMVPDPLSFTGIRQSAQNNMAE